MQALISLPPALLAAIVIAILPRILPTLIHFIIALIAIQADNVGRANRAERILSVLIRSFPDEGFGKIRHLRDDNEDRGDDRGYPSIDQ